MSPTLNRHWNERAFSEDVRAARLMAHAPSHVRGARCRAYRRVRGGRESVPRKLTQNTRSRAAHVGSRFPYPRVVAVDAVKLLVQRDGHGTPTDHRFSLADLVTLPPLLRRLALHVTQKHLRYLDDKLYVDKQSTLHKLVYVLELVNHSYRITSICFVPAVITKICTSDTRFPAVWAEISQSWNLFYSFKISRHFHIFNTVWSTLRYGGNDMFS